MPETGTRINCLETVRRTARILRWAVIAIGLAMLALSAFASPLSFAAAGPQSASPVEVLPRVASQIGIHRCWRPIAEVSKRSSPGSVKQDLLVDWDRAHPDLGPFFSLTALQYDAGSALLSLTAVPGKDGDCAVMVERISHVDQACAALAHVNLPMYKSVELVKNVRVYNDKAHPGETITLVESGTGCIVVKRQVKYGWVSE